MDPQISDYGVYGKMYELINTYNSTSGMFGLANNQESQNAYLQQAEYRQLEISSPESLTSSVPAALNSLISFKKSAVISSFGVISGMSGG